MRERGVAAKKMKEKSKIVAGKAENRGLREECSKENEGKCKIVAGKAENRGLRGECGKENEGKEQNSCQRRKK